MQRVRLGDTSLEVSRLCFGTGLIGHLLAKLPPEQAGQMLKQAFDLGVTFWDTADEYKTHAHVRKGLKLVGRERIVLATKTQAHTAEQAEADIARFLVELDTDHLDLVHLHGVDSAEDFAVRRGALAALRKAKDKGTIGHVGLSTHSVAVGRLLPELRDEGIEASLVVLNKTGDVVKDGTTADMAAAVERAADRGLGIYAMKVLGQGKALTRHSLDELFAYDLALPCVHSLVVGMITTREVRQNVEIVERLDPPRAG